MTEPVLEIYAFSTVAWSAMGQSIASFHRAEVRRREAERRYTEQFPATAPDPFEELEAQLVLHDLAAVSDDRQYRLAALRLQGYTIAEIALSQGMSKSRVCRLLRELYRVYLDICAK